MDKKKKPVIQIEEEECRLSDENDRIIAMGSRDLMQRYLKHHVPDGLYSIKGPRLALYLRRVDGFVMPSNFEEKRKEN